MTKPAAALVQRQARALGDRTRFEIFRYVAESPSPVRVAALATHFGVNQSAIRQHLAKLCEARLLIEEQGSGARTGRPPYQYRLAPAAMGTWGSAGPYELLSLLLLEVASGRRTPVEAGAEAGRGLAADHREGAHPVDVIESEMARRGFEPRRHRLPTSVEIVLERCPFEAAATADPGVVCEIHRGLVEGILDAMGAELCVADLVTYDPRQAGCRLQLRAEAAAPNGQAAEARSGRVRPPEAGAAT